MMLSETSSEKGVEEIYTSSYPTWHLSTKVILLFPLKALDSIDSKRDLYVKMYDKRKEKSYISIVYHLRRDHVQ